MGSGLGPKVPIDNLEFAYDPRSALASSYKSIFGDITGTVTGASIAGLGTTLGLLLSAATDVLNLVSPTPDSWPPFLDATFASKISLAASVRLKFPIFENLLEFLCGYLYFRVF